MIKVKVGDRLNIVLPNKFCKGPIYTQEGYRPVGSSHQYEDVALPNGAEVEVISKTDRTITLVTNNQVCFSVGHNFAKELFGIPDEAATNKK